ncbi:MAG TPA: hypothetical protein VJG13_15635, partial [Thermoanaerobaculia bacterium]|nr:hypothetical protein [Thermoanaerobaculia bacterium]
NWHFHMGFVSYVLALPAALFALGWWWRGRREMTWGRSAVLALLILVTYLLHLYAFGVLAFVLGVLALSEGRREGGAGRLLARTLAAFLPALALLAGVVARGADRSAGEQGPLLLLYGNLRRKMLLALGALPSFSLAWETALFAAGVATAVALAVVAWRRGRRPAVSWLLAAGALAVLYLLLPDHVGRVFFVSNRVPLFVLLVGLVALPVPDSPRARGWALGIFAGLAVAHASVLAYRYLEIGRRLADYEAAIAVLPADARVAFRVHKASMAEGRIAPAALFGGYHYLEAPGARIPDLEHFVGTLRTVSYRDQTGRSLSTASVGSEEELSELLSRPWLVGPGGLLLVVGEDAGGRIAEAAARSGFRELVAGPRAALYRKARRAPPARPEEPFFATGYPEGFDYLVVYRDPELPPPELEPSLEPVIETGWAAAYRRPRAAHPPPGRGPEGS